MNKVTSTIMAFGAATAIYVIGMAYHNEHARQEDNRNKMVSALEQKIECENAIANQGRLVYDFTRNNDGEMFYDYTLPAGCKSD